jgi:hypothetical protein
MIKPCGRAYHDERGGVRGCTEAETAWAKSQKLISEEDPTMREGYHLTDEAETERQDFRTEYGDGNCSCHISPQCGSCTHPGNPMNLAEDDSAWVKDDLAHLAMHGGDDLHLSGMIQYTDEQKAEMLEEAHAAIRENRPFDIRRLRASFGFPADPQAEWFPEPSAGRQIFTFDAPEPIDHSMYAPTKEPPGPMCVTDKEIARRRKARKIANKSKRRNWR